jgi:hypothetical protein
VIGFGQVKVMEKEQYSIFIRRLSTMKDDNLLLTDDAPLIRYCPGKDMPVMHPDGIKSLIW